MNVTLEFALPDEREGLEHALKAADYACALADFREWLRQASKHRDEPPPFEEVREAFFAVLTDYTIET